MLAEIAQGLIAHLGAMENVVVHWTTKEIKVSGWDTRFKREIVILPPEGMKSAMITGIVYLKYDIIHKHEPQYFSDAKTGLALAIELFAELCEMARATV